MSPSRGDAPILTPRVPLADLLFSRAPQFPVVPFPQTGTARIMPQGAGYAIEIGFGLFFSVVTVALTYLEGKFAGTKLTSEHFNTAGRDVKTGLTASVIVSQWTWAATLLQSSNVAWQYGITGPF